MGGNGSRSATARQGRAGGTERPLQSYSEFVEKWGDNSDDLSSELWVDYGRRGLYAGLLQVYLEENDAYGNARLVSDREYKEVANDPRSIEIDIPMYGMYVNGPEGPEFVDSIKSGDRFWVENGAYADGIIAHSAASNAYNRGLDAVVSPTARVESIGDARLSFHREVAHNDVGRDATTEQLSVYARSKGVDVLKDGDTYYILNRGALVLRRS